VHGELQGWHTWLSPGLPGRFRPMPMHWQVTTQGTFLLVVVVVGQLRNFNKPTILGNQGSVVNKRCFARMAALSHVLPRTTGTSST
jgi:hypothetical protein